jgi:hypothetical protein
MARFATMVSRAAYVLGALAVIASSKFELFNITWHNITWH